MIIVGILLTIISLMMEQFNLELLPNELIVLILNKMNIRDLIVCLTLDKYLKEFRSYFTHKIDLHMKLMNDKIWLLNKFVEMLSDGLTSVN